LLFIVIYLTFSESNYCFVIETIVLVTNEKINLNDAPQCCHYVNSLGNGVVYLYKNKLDEHHTIDESLSG
jgi:hypothetical protein